MRFLSSTTSSRRFLAKSEMLWVLNLSPSSSSIKKTARSRLCMPLAVKKALTGLANHPVDGDDEILDIQALVFNADPPKIKIISGWDSHFDKLIYEQFNHAFVIRAWV